MGQRGRPKKIIDGEVNQSEELSSELQDSPEVEEVIVSDDTINTTPIQEVEAIDKTFTEEVKFVAEESEAKKSFRLLIENYKKKNPVKYEMKKKALEAQLNNLK